ncbi:MAG TPA: hypothetical protein DDY13_11790 [Cytophagales bacterium]|jgi:hypothetical protein|nr:hypothetical protein [Cytophagales bacterium]
MSELELKKHQDKIYDLAKNHFLGDFPDGLPIEKAYLHIGMYMGWIIDHDLYSGFFEDEASTEIYRFKRRELGCIILAEIWDGSLSFDLFNRQGNMFTSYYYSGGLFRNDYLDTLVTDKPSIYHVEDTWENYEKINSRVSMRFDDWKKMTQ